MDSAACKAIRAMGTNSIPFLVEDIVARDPSWRGYLQKRFRNSRFAWLRESPAQTSRARASKALRLLGPQAAPALPLLIEEVRKSEGQSGLPWVGISAIVYSVPNTVAAITNELNTPQCRGQAAYFLGIFATNETVALPFLIQCAQDEKWRTRYQALTALERFRTRATAAVPVIQTLLDNTNAVVSKQAAEALESITGAEQSRR